MVLNMVSCIHFNVLAMFLDQHHPYTLDTKPGIHPTHPHVTHITHITHRLSDYQQLQMSNKVTTDGWYWTWSRVSIPMSWAIFLGQHHPYSLDTKPGIHPTHPHITHRLSDYQLQISNKITHHWRMVSNMVQCIHFNVLAMFLDQRHPYT